MDIITDFASGIDLLDLHAFGLSNHSVVNLNVGTFQGNSTANNFFVNGPTTSVVVQHAGGRTNLR